MLVGTWWVGVSMERNWLIHDCTWSVEGDTGWYLVELGEYVAVLVGTWWYWLIYDGTGSVWGPICWYIVAMQSRSELISRKFELYQTPAKMEQLAGISKSKREN